MVQLEYLLALRVKKLMQTISVGALPAWVFSVILCRLQSVEFVLYDENIRVAKRSHYYFWLFYPFCSMDCVFLMLKMTVNALYIFSCFPWYIFLQVHTICIFTPLKRESMNVLSGHSCTGWLVIFSCRMCMSMRFWHVFNSEIHPVIEC